MNSTLKHTFFSLMCVLAFSANTFGAAPTVVPNQFPGPTEYINSFTNSEEIDKNNALQAPILKQALLDIVAVLDEALTYWRGQKYTPYQYFINKGPTGWFKGVWPQEEIEEHIKTIERYLSTYCAQLGTLQRIIHKHNVPEKSWSNPLPKTIVWIDLYKKAALKSFAQLCKPSHFKRNWSTYVAAGMGTAIVAGALYANQDKIGDLVDKYIKATNDFVENYINKPWKELKKAIFIENKGESITNELAKSYQAVFSAIPEYEKKEDKFWIELAKKSLLEDDTSLLDSELMKAYQARVQVYKFGFGSDDGFQFSNIGNNFKTVNQLFLLKLQSKINSIDENFFRQNRLTSILAGFAPAAAVGTFSLWTIKKALHVIKGKKNYQPLRETLSEISRVLTKNNVSTITTLSDSDEGLLTYLYNKFERQALKLMTPAESDGIMRDMQELSSSNFTIAQKCAVVDRMYRSFGYLNPSYQSV